MNTSRDEQRFFNQVYASSFPVVFRVVLRIVGDQESAEEICHDAFIKFFQHSRSLPDGDQARYWVIRVAKNLAFNLAKRRGRERTAFERAFFEPQRPSRPADSDTLESESQVLIRQAVNRLPKTLRDVIVLKEYGDLPYTEIARVLGITVSNVKVRVYRARERLASMLEESDVHIPE
ncbi:RNA polymerase subunit sigma-24 [Alkalispirochaeta sphaeroplastigenens]|uniref:RNA polymerase subunit sigma-24 n=1 Tax=Alkalispirochaeta sphaeroplastigenens TaxID=1187066 RepID=A0A2S4K167_9SPIO|nr:RNA polymerase sigma factor [Alkalispirochaeta sphaeroplastigenens]POR05499.1 RNA polymerase subunit sigma-24 [Alkalispirochaeta sphaeroplastigenens]